MHLGEVRYWVDSANFLLRTWKNYIVFEIWEAGAISLDMSAADRASCPVHVRNMKQTAKQVCSFVHWLAFVCSAGPYEKVLFRSCWNHFRGPCKILWLRKSFYEHLLSCGGPVRNLPQRSLHYDLEDALHWRCWYGSSSGMLMISSWRKVLQYPLNGRPDFAATYRVAWFSLYSKELTSYPPTLFGVSCCFLEFDETKYGDLWSFFLRENGIW